MGREEHPLKVAILFDPDIDDGYMKQFVSLAGTSFEPGTRVVGTLAGRRFSRAVYRRPDGTPCLRFGKSWLADAGLTVGELVELQVMPDPDPDHVELPDELEDALAAAPDVARAWRTLTPGKRRTLAYPVARAKRPETRARRARAVVDQIRKTMP